MLYVHHVPGRLRVRLRHLKANALVAQAACEMLRDLPGITQVDANPATGSLTVKYDHREVAVDGVWQVLHREGLVSSPVPNLGDTPQMRAQAGATVEARVVGTVVEAAIGFLIEKLLERSAVALIGALI